MGCSAVLIAFVLYLCYFVVRSEIPAGHEDVPSETWIEENIGMSKHAVGSSIETVPEICPSGFKCGFQIYNEVTREPSHPFIKYCTCPEDSHCVQVGDNVIQHFFYYQCKVLEQGDVSMPTHDSTTAEQPDILETDELASVMKGSTQEFTIPTYVSSESTTGPSLDEIVEQYVVLPGSYEESNSPLNLKKYEVESSDSENTAPPMPTRLSAEEELHTIYIAESTVDHRLDEISEQSVSYPGSYEESTSLLQNLEKYRVESSDPRNPDMPIPAHFSTKTQQPDILDSKELSSVIPDSTQSFANPIYIKSTIDPSLDEIAEPSVAFQGHEEPTSAPQNVEKDVESSDPSNTGFTIPIYISTESTIGPSLDEVSESSAAYPGSNQTSLSRTTVNEMDGSIPIFKGSETLESVIDCDVNTDANIGRNCGAIEPSAGDPDSEIFSSLKNLVVAKQETQSFDGANNSASETDCSTSEEQNVHAIKSFVAESSSVDTVKETLVASANVGVVDSSEQSSLRYSDSNIESTNLLQELKVNTTVELPHDKDEL